MEEPVMVLNGYRVRCSTGSLDISDVFKVAIGASYNAYQATFDDDYPPSSEFKDEASRKTDQKRGN